MRELTNYGARLGTKFTSRCVNIDYSQKEMFYTTKKNNYIFEMNRKSVLTSRLIGKEHKICQNYVVS